MAKNYKTLELDPKYVPKKTEEYMCVEQKAYFYKALIDMRKELLAETGVPVVSTEIEPGDEGDSSVMEQELAFRLRTNERAARLLKKIDFSLERLENGTYGYSILSGDEIGLKRLIVKPEATLTLAEKEERDINTR